MTLKAPGPGIILELLGNENSTDVLRLTSKTEYSASQLTEELKIAPATIYRKLNQLEDAGMIKHVKTIMDYHGNDEKYYRCSIRRVIIDFKNGKMSIQIEKEYLSDKIIRLWKRIARS